MTLYASSYKTTSDSTVKKNIEPLPPGALNKVLSMRPITFEFKDEQGSIMDNNPVKIGLMAQELELLVPEAVSYSDLGKIKMIDYDMLIPVLIKAIQEQEIKIESLEKEIGSLQSANVNLKNASNNENIEIEELTDNMSLEQNFPNPFTENTEIKYSVPESVKNATIYIYNMSGLQIRSIPIHKKGKGSITIIGSELLPGLYLYALIADGKEVGIKRMILTE
jgi:hypothetical protein